MTGYWFNTDEIEEAVSALEVLANWSENLTTDVSYWKWVILATHNATQGFMVLALRGSDRLRPLRDDFIHFLPQSWSIEVSGLPMICRDCLDIIHFLGWESGNVAWYEQDKRIRAEKAITLARSNLALTSKAYV